MGISLIDNFRSPYLSGSIKEFWRRWHISLSSWFRDYLYIPLGGNRVSFPRWMMNTMIVFVVCGIWHGANWTFMLWGAAYGVLLIIEKIITDKTGKRLSLHIPTFIIVTLLWSIFRAPTFSALKDLYSALLHGGGNEHLSADLSVWIALVMFIILDIVLRNTRFDIWCMRLKTPLRWCIYAVMIFAIIAFSSVEQYPFIYFQF